MNNLGNVFYLGHYHILFYLILNYFQSLSYIEKEHENEVITQHEILNNVDLFSAQKYFDLNLDKFGPYRLNYSRNGRHLLIAGEKGHVATFDWQTKKLNSEINVMERVSDAKYLK